MVIYTSGTVEALVVFKASDGKKGLLWIPSLARKQNYDKLEQYNLGKWLRFDMGADKIVEPMETGPYESHQGSASPLVSGLNTPVPLAEVRAPVVFFSDTQYCQSIGYSLAFGRIASIADGTPTIPMDTLCHAWIGYISLFRNNALRHWLKSFDVNWALSDMPEPFTKAELKAAHEESLIQLQNGIVVGREENVELGLDADQAAKPGMPKTCTVLKIWTAEAGNQVCIHRIISTEAEGTGNYDSKAALAVGDWCRFLPFKNWSLSMSAVSPYAIKAPEGISLVQTEPILKLKISHEHYKLDQDPDASRLHVPKWLGTIECPRDFIRELRTASQRRPKMAPRLFVELCPHSLSWLPVDFDGRACSPPPPSSHHQPQPTATTATRAQHGSEKQFTAYRNPPRIISTSDSSTGSGSNTEGSCVTVVQKSASSTTIKQEEQQPESNKETNVEEMDKEQQVEPPVSGSFGRSRKRDFPATSAANRSQSASNQQQRSSSSQAQQKVGVEGAKASVSRESLAAESSTSTGIKKEAEDRRPPRPPSIASDFGKGDDDDDEEENNDANADNDKNQSQPPPRGGKATGSFGQSTSSSSSAATERIHDGLFVYTAADLRRDREAAGNGSNGSEPPTFLESASRTAAAARRPPPAGRRQFPNTSAGSSYRPQATRAGATTDFGDSRRGPAGPAAAGPPSRPPFPPRGVPPQTQKPRINRNLSGVVTSTSPDGGVFIYTPAYPRREIYVPRTLVRPEVQQGSWLLFDAIEDRDGPKIGTYTVEERPPFETIPVGNSILLKLRACVPLRWNPVLSTHNPVVPTDFVEEVVDYQGLLNQDCENEQIPVIVLRRTPEQAAQDPRFPGNPWVIERINDW